MTKPNDPVQTVLENAVGGKAAGLVSVLRRYNIHTNEQFHGALNPYLPKLDPREIQQKALTANYSKIREQLKSPDEKVRRIQKLFSIGKSDATKILKELESISFPQRLHLDSKSALSLGCQSPQKRRRTPFWTVTKPVQTFSPSFVLPRYDAMGPLFDQGERGTCVANAATSMMDYLSEERCSRQFLYHQCKMLDGIPDASGTYIETSINAMEDETLADRGNVSENEWPYVPFKGDTEHQGPPPENCYDALRQVGLEPVFIRTTSVVSDIKTLVGGSSGYSPTPVVVGLDLYESFENPHSTRTGWITMPLPGESCIGGHAMLVVGWFDDEELFLVRNSWGLHWASENAKGCPGHALIPYRYFQEHCHSGAAVFRTHEAHVHVPPHERLYNREPAPSEFKKAALAKTRSEGKAKAGPVKDGKSGAEKGSISRGIRMLFKLAATLGLLFCLLYGVLFYHFILLDDSIKILEKADPSFHYTFVDARGGKKYKLLTVPALVKAGIKDVVGKHSVTIGGKEE